MKNPNLDDYKKLTSCVRYIRDTMNMPLMLGAIYASVMIRWIKASYGVNSYMKSHPGGMMSLWKGYIHIKSSKQKLNTRILT